MKFSLNLFNIVSEMGNEYDDELEDYGDDVVWEVMRMLLSGEIKLEIDDDGYLVIDVPDVIIIRRRW